MGLLVNGKWQDDWYKPDEKGRFKRPETQFRSWIGGEDDGFTAESGRYHLYVSLACPWAHRTLIMRRLKGLEKHIPVSIVNPQMGDRGWTFDAYDDCTGDGLFDSDLLYQVYLRARADYTGRVTVPVLWDKQKNTIVNNESRELLRMFDHAFTALSDPEAPDFAPEALYEEIDAMIDANYEPINNGVYKCGFAAGQNAYDEAVEELFARLDAVDSILGSRRYLCGDQVTEADICLYTTLVRFDMVYAIHFKCSRKRIIDYPNIWPYLRDLYQHEAFRQTTSFQHIRQHYFWSHPTINPKRIVAVAPDIDFEAPHKRG